MSAVCATRTCSNWVWCRKNNPEKASHSPCWCNAVRWQQSWFQNYYAWSHSRPVLEKNRYVCFDLSPATSAQHPRIKTRCRAELIPACCAQMDLAGVKNWAAKNLWEVLVKSGWWFLLGTHHRVSIPRGGACVWFATRPHLSNYPKHPTNHLLFDALQSW